MTSFFPDLNVWLALSVEAHAHHSIAWQWFRRIPDDSRLLFSRFTQIGLLSLLTNSAAMGERVLTVREAWEAYDAWLNDPRVELYPEPLSAESAFREAMKPFAAKSASKWVGDCWLVAFATGVDAALVTFDRALLDFARKYGVVAVTPV